MLEKFALIVLLAISVLRGKQTNNQREMFGKTKQKKNCGSKKQKI